MLLLLCASTIIFYIFLKWRFSFWKNLNIPSEYDNIIFGNLTRFIFNRESSHGAVTRFYKTMKARNYQHAGFYGGIIPFYIPISNTLIGDILTRQYKHFCNRGFYYNEKSDPIGAHVFSLDGPKWRDVRSRLTPAYTLSKVKEAIEAQITAAVSLEERIRKSVEKKIPVNVNEMCSKYGMDLIASCAFGLNTKTLDDPESDFRKHGLLALRDYQASFKFGFCYIFKNQAKTLGLRFVHKSVSEYFRNLSKSMVEMRDEKKFRRNDLLQMLIDLKNGGWISADELYAESYAVFIAGFNTTTLTISYCLYEIVKDCRIQELVKEEISRVLDEHNGELSYEALLEMEYLQQVIDETLRMYPPVPVYLRECSEDFPIPNTDAILPKGTRVIIPVYGIQHDEEYFPEPEKFDPDRFSKENQRNIVPHTYMPFGEGPRLCIAVKFAMIQVKLAIIAFLKNNWFRLNKNTPEKMTLAKNAIFLYAEDDVILDCI